MIDQYIAQVAQFATFHPRVSLEIGALDGEYSRALQRAFGMLDKNLYLVEPNPALHHQLQSSFPASNKLFCAISEVDGMLEFNQVLNPEKNKVGCSSLMERIDGWQEQLMYTRTSVESITGASLLDRIRDPVDLCIVDVEGMAFQVLASLGDRLRTIRSFMIECEHSNTFRGQRLFPDVAELMEANGFRMMAFQFSYPQQSDSVWIRNSDVDLSGMKPLPVYLSQAIAS
jgi:FkbM family methyltransferase